ncbi:MAG: helix-turn-helix domain-containing protein [Coprobacillaceae bacterium]
MNDIGKRIKERRDELGLSQDELAIKLGYKSRSSINKIEKNGRNLPQKKIKAIADALNTTPSYIMGWEEKKQDLYSDTNKDIIVQSSMNDLKEVLDSNTYEIFKLAISLNEESKKELLKRAQELEVLEAHKK